MKIAPTRAAKGSSAARYIDIVFDGEREAVEYAAVKGRKRKCFHKGPRCLNGQSIGVCHYLECLSY
ncbi:unnamed protein product [marine sediment metagenome]|uniref:Uncharacterized protein n=1 Tax=marine sediment metagenome TaxID=412755 RepID=X0T408_9ZZZZ